MNKKNKMGYIYPRAIQAILRGETPKMSVSMYVEKAEQAAKDLKPGDTWEDAEGRKWKINETGTKVRETIMDGARMPWWCPKCEKIMNKRLDDKMYWSQGMCFDCVIKRDTDMQIAGTFGGFEQKFLTDRIIGFLKDAKIEIERYMEGLSDKQEFVNEDGSLEEWTGDVQKVRDFLEKELTEIEKALIKAETGE